MKSLFANIVHLAAFSWHGEALAPKGEKAANAQSVHAGITLSHDGFFLKNASLFYPVGVNYWPASCGCNLWYADPFPEEEIQHDFDVLASSPFNAVRIFLTWGAFEPKEGIYDQTKFHNLAKMISWASSRGLVVDVSVFVGWMSGRLYWPSWKGNRNLYTDPAMVNRSIAFALEAAKVAEPFKHSLLAMEYGNEMNIIDNADVDHIIAWTNRIYEAFKTPLPGVLVVPGTDESTITGQTAWPLGGLTGRIAGDVLNFHPYAVLFTPTKGDGFFDSLTGSGPTYDGLFVRSYGPSFMQEWGTLVTGGVSQQDAYLRRILPESLSNGVCGFLYWCMRDIRDTSELPYYTNGLETMLGLFDSDDHIKPGLTFYADFARNLSERTSPPLLPENDPEVIGLYVPKHYYMSGDRDNPGNFPSVQSGHATLAYTMLNLLGYRARVVRGDLMLPNPCELKVLIVTSSMLVASEIFALEQFVKAGGKLLWHGLTSSYFQGSTKIPLERLIGARSEQSLPANFTATVDFGGAEWQLAQDDYLRGSSEYAPLLFHSSATKVWSDRYTGMPLLLLKQEQNKGGAVLASVSAVETAILKLMGKSSSRDNWKAWYSTAFDCLLAGCNQSRERPASSFFEQAAPETSHSSPMTYRGNFRVHNYSSPVALVYGSAQSAVITLPVLSSLGFNASRVSNLTATGLEHASLLFVVHSMPLPFMRTAQQWLEASEQRCVIWSGTDTSALSRSLYTMAGVAAVDIRSVDILNISFSEKSFIFKADGTLLEFSTVKPVQRPEWGVAEVISRDHKGIALIHRHIMSKNGGTFVLSSASAESSKLLSSDIQGWYAALLSLCQGRDESIQI